MTHFIPRPHPGDSKFQIPRIELSRLTVRQYKTAIADLLGSFQSPGRWDDQRGLKGEYSSRGRRRRDSNGGGSSLNRVDPEIRLDFGTGSPIPDQNALAEIAKSWQSFPVLPVPLSTFRGYSQDFRVNWQGSILVPETGEYEFVVRTENATRLWVNDKVRPLIDAAVKSGSDTDYRAAIYLLGGRVYPVKLELSRTKEKTSSISLEWKLPRRAFEVIPRRNLSPSIFP